MLKSRSPETTGTFFFVSGLLRLTLSGCLALTMEDSLRKERGTVLQGHLTQARHFFAAGEYEKAGMQYEAAAKDEALHPPGATPVKTGTVRLASAEYREAVDGACVAYQRSQSWQDALRACQGAAATPGSTSGDAIPHVQREL